MVTPACPELTDEAAAAAAEQEHLSAPLDFKDPPPLDRFCDLILQGGVIDGLVYPGLLMELARRFRFHSLGGTSVGALAASLLAACEYRRRYGGLSGFNEGLRTLPRELAEHVDAQGKMTRIHSLFQAKPAVQPLFALGLDVVEHFADADQQQRTQAQTAHTTTAPLRSAWRDAWAFYQRLRPVLLQHFPGKDRWWVYALLWVATGYAAVTQGVWAFALMLLLQAAYWIGAAHLAPVWAVWKQVQTLGRMPGHGLCTGMRVNGSQHPGLTEWLHQGIQQAAGLPLALPLTFEGLWAAPGGPVDASTGHAHAQSIRLFVLTSALSHGRAYKLPHNDPTARLFFKLSEWEPYFPAEVMEHLQRVSAPMSLEHGDWADRYAARYQVLQAAQKTEALERLVAQKSALHQAAQHCDGKGRVDLRELPYAQLPLLVAARLSLSVPFLLDAIPMWALDLENPVEDMGLRRVWMSDGGLISNFPIHAFDRAVPRWPTFGVQIVDQSFARRPDADASASHLPYRHDQGANDVFVEGPASDSTSGSPLMLSGREGLWAFIQSIFKTLMSGEDQSHLRMPDVRNRVLRVYTQKVLGSAINLKVKPHNMLKAARNGIIGGRQLAAAYLNEITHQGQPVRSWSDHRWVRLNLMIEQLRQYLAGFGSALHDPRMQSQTLMQQIQQATTSTPIASQMGPPLWTAAQQQQLMQNIASITALEAALRQATSHMPYTAQPQPVIKSKPDL